MPDPILRKISLETFTNKIALAMGNDLITLAQSQNQKIAIEIARLNHTVFLFVDDDLPADKHNWLRRKANISRHFEESSLAIKHDLIDGKMTLDQTFALDANQYLAKGGSIPIFVNNAGMVATITVSGLSDTEDHQLILKTLQGKYF